MSDTRSLLNELIKTGKIGYVRIGEAPSDQGGFNSVFFAETKNMDSSSIRLAISTDNNELTREETANNFSYVQFLLVENGVDKRYLQNFLYYGEKGVKVSFQASETSLKSFLEANIKDGVGQLTRDEIKNIFGQILGAVDNSRLTH